MRTAHFESIIGCSDRKIHVSGAEMLYFCLKKRVRSDRMVKTPKKANENARKTEKQPHMKAAGTQHNIERNSFRHANRAERLSSRAVFARENTGLAMRMRQHAEQADAVAAAL